MLVVLTTPISSSLPSYIAYTVTGKQQLPATVYLPCGLAAGLLAATTTQPFDVVKTRMQLEPHSYSRFAPTMVSLVRSEGVHRLFTGLVPRVTRRTLMAAFTWAFYEEVSPLNSTVLLFDVLLSCPAVDTGSFNRAH